MGLLTRIPPGQRPEPPKSSRESLDAAARLDRAGGAATGPRLWLSPAVAGELIALNAIGTLKLTAKAGLICAIRNLAQFKHEGRGGPQDHVSASPEPSP